MFPLSEDCPESETEIPNVVRVKENILRRMEEHAGSHPNEECCGLLGGPDSTITAILPARNILASATAYEISAKELFDIFRTMRKAGLRHLGIYHSHVSGDNSPSPTDIARAYYPEAAYFIISPRLDATKPIRAFSLHPGNVTELKIVHVP
jgi:proteasome lid subunit RPN8/RPN11